MSHLTSMVSSYLVQKTSAGAWQTLFKVVKEIAFLYEDHHSNSLVLANQTFNHVSSLLIQRGTLGSKRAFLKIIIMSTLWEMST